MKTSIVIFAFIITIFQTPFAQTGDNILDYEVVPPSPSVSALDKYIDFPVGSYTGIPEIRVPIYELVQGSLKVPISLSYHAGGIRVDEVSSWVGLGWSLDAGGAISRTVKGSLPDELSNGYLNAQYYLDLLENNPNDDEVIRLVYSQGIDLLPDIWRFNTPTSSGSFFYGKDEEIHHAGNNQKFKIEKVYPGNNYKITDDNGIIYIFKEEEKTSPPRGSNWITAWMMDKIISSDKQDTLHFLYKEDDFSYNESVYQSVDVMLGCSNNGLKFNEHTTQCDLPCIDNCNSLIPSNPVFSSNSSLTRYKSKKIHAIIGRNIAIYFKSSNTRLDLRNNELTDPNPLKALKLDEINIYNLNGVYQQTGGDLNQILNNYVSLDHPSLRLINHLEFEYEQVQTPDYNPNDSQQSRYYRLFLKNVSFTGHDFQNDNNTYGFSYYNHNQLPEKLSLKIDHWGFFNNQNNQYLIPSKTLNGYPIPFANANRRTYSDFAKYGVLHEVEYPTKGKLKIEYESNQVPVEKDDDEIFVKWKEEKTKSANSTDFVLDWKSSYNGTGILNKYINSDCELCQPDPQNTCSEITHDCIEALDNLGEPIDLKCPNNFPGDCSFYVENYDSDGLPYETSFFRKFSTGSVIGAISFNINTTGNQSNCNHPCGQVLVAKVGNYNNPIVNTTIYNNGNININNLTLQSNSDYVMLVVSYNWSANTKQIIPTISWKEDKQLVNMDVGGLRVKIMQLTNQNNEVLLSKIFNYNLFNNINKSSGILTHLPSYVSTYKGEKECCSSNSPGFSYENRYRFNSRDKVNVLGNSPQIVGYINVSETYANNSKLEKTYIPVDGYLTAIRENGRIAKEVYYDDNQVKKKEVQYDYLSPAITYTTPVYYIVEKVKNAIYPRNGTTFVNPVYNVEIYTYADKRDHRVSQISTKEFDDSNNETTKLSKYYYQNDLHLLLTKQEEVFASNDVITNTFYYPLDLITPQQGYQTDDDFNAIVKLKDNHLLNALISKKTERGILNINNSNKVIDANYITYNENHLKPKAIHLLNTSEPIISTNFTNTHANNGEIVIDSRLDIFPKKSFIYNSKARPIRVTNQDGTYTEYIWSNDGMFVLETKTYESGNSFITKFEYNNETLIKNIENENNFKTHYLYDNHNRLSTIKNDDNHFIKSFHYHIKQD